MWIAFIAPKSLAELAAHGHYYFLLQDTVTPFYETSSKFKMLDNGAYEGTTITVPELLKLAAKYKVNEIAMPDYIQDYRRTMDATALAVSEVLKITDKYSIAVTPQGRSIQEWLVSYRQMIEIKGVRTICIPKWLGKNRPYVIAHLMKLGLWKPIQFSYHLFGLDYLEELDIYRRLGALIRSVDTSMPFSCAVAGKAISYFDVEKVPRVKFNAILTAAQKQLAIENMQVLKDIVSSI